MLNYLHIPKCGGSAIRNYIRNRFSNQIKVSPQFYSIFVYGKNAKLGSCNVSVEDLVEDSEFRSGLASKHSDFRGYLLGVVGHLNYQQLSSFLNEFNVYGNIFSIVRNPLDRLVSNINYLKITADNSKKSFALNISQENLFDYLLSHAEKNNGASYQCNFLGADLRQNVLINEREIQNIIFSNIHVYKLENSVLAINNHIAPVNQDFKIEKKNISQEQKNKSSASSEISLVSLDSIDAKKMGALKDAYRNDFLLFEMAA